MPRIAPTVPEESETLCEGCGYTLNGLPENGRCPECGKPMIESSNALRIAPAWEQAELPLLQRFWATTVTIIRHPTQFYRTLTTRSDVAPARRFAQLHWMISSLFFAVTAYIHSAWSFGSFYPDRLGQGLRLCIFAVMGVVVYFFLFGVTLLAGKLTNVEANYRGLRLPIKPVLRGLFYHAAHYLPVSALALLTVAGYRLLVQFDIVSLQTAPQYLYVLGGEVILSAVYLFQTYWIGMRNMMYANR